jgi:hypothetical protein
MSRRGWERTGGLAGILFAISIAVGIVGGGPPPDYGTSSKDLVKYFADWKAGLQGTYLIGNALPDLFGAWFFGTLTIALWRAPGEARFGAFIGGIASALLASSATAVAVIFAILIYDAPVLGPDSPVLQALYDGTQVSLGLITFIGGVIPLAFGLAMLGLTGAWRGVGYAGILVALINFVVGIVTFAVGFKVGPAGLLGIGTFLLWSIAVAIVLAWRGVPEPAVG